MPRLKQEPRTTTTVDVAPVLSPTLALKLRPKLAEWHRVHQQIKALSAAKDALAQEIGAIRDEAGEMSIECDGFRVTLVGGTSSKLNKKKLIALGCAPAWLEEATEIKPKKAYEKITAPGDASERGGDDDEG